MLAKIDFIPDSDPSTIKNQPYYHSLYGFVSLLETDVGSNRSKARLSTQQVTWINHNDLYKLVVSAYPNDQFNFQSGDDFYYYQMNHSFPKLDKVYKVDESGIIGKYSKMLIYWPNIFKVAGDLDRSDYYNLITSDSIHKVLEVDFYPPTEEYFIVPEKREQIAVNNIFFDVPLLKKELYKQGFNLEKR